MTKPNRETDPSGWLGPAGVEFWRTVCEQTFDYLSIIDDDLRFVWVDRTHPSLTVDDVIGQRVTEFVSDDAVDRIVRCVDQVRKTGEPFGFIGQSDVGGEPAWLETHAFPVPEAPGRFLLATRDVTELRRTQLARDEAERISRSLIDTFPDIILVMNPDGVVLATNPTTAAAFGTTEEELVGTNAFDRMDREVAERRRGWARTVVETGRPLRRTDAHRDRHFDSVAFPLVSVDGVVKRLAVISRDVTEQRRAEQMLRERELRRWHSEKMEALGTLASGIAHDLNNLLTPIMVNAELASRPDTPSERRGELLSSVQAAAQRAEKLIQQVLVTARDDTVTHISIDLRDTISEVADFVRSTLPDGVELSVDVPSQPVRISADATQVHQAIMNLCINAAQAMPKGEGSVAIDLRVIEPTDSDRVPLELTPGPYARLRVCDSGTGIPPEVLPRIFDPFYSTKDPDQGTGLGLYVVHGVASSHAGAITVESTPSDGTTFVLWLPADDPVAPYVAEASPTETSEHPAAPGSRVLLLEDEQFVANAAVMILESAGYDVQPFATCTDALSEFEGSPDAFRAAIVDQRLGDGNGIDVARRMRSLRADFPVLLCSGHVTGDIQQICRAENIRVLAKPYDVDELLDAMDRL